MQISNFSRHQRLKDNDEESVDARDMLADLASNSGAFTPDARHL